MHVTWHEDLPLLVLRVLERPLKRWAAGAVRGTAQRVFRTTLPRIVLGADVPVVEFEIRRQMNRESGKIRIVVEPRVRADLWRMREWAKRHEGLTRADFERHRRLSN